MDDKLLHYMQFGQAGLHYALGFLEGLKHNDDCDSHGGVTYEARLDNLTRGIVSLIDELNRIKNMSAGD